MFFFKKPPRGHFNPLPRKEGDFYGVTTDYLLGRISIHSLVKRETTACQRQTVKEKISIHSLVKRETLKKDRLPKADGISIHSLVKRETRRKPERKYHYGHFNPLPRKEGDMKQLETTVSDLQFQSTPS
mgnify:CR=1 FL=1